MPNLFVQRTFMLNTPVLREGLEFWYVAGRGHLPNQPPIKTLDTQSPISIPGKGSRILHRSLLAKGKCTLCDSLGKDSWKLGSGFLWTLPYVLFPFTDFALYPLTVITHHSCENNYVLSPVSPVNH